jgi:hypothetical protein
MVFEILSADITVWTDALVARFADAAQFIRGNARWFAESLISWFAIGFTPRCFTPRRINGLNLWAAGGSIPWFGSKLVQ